MASIPMSQKGQTLDSARRPLIQATLALIAQSGVRGATLRDIGRACDVNIATISNLFENKEGLVAECFAAAVEADRIYLDAWIDEAAALKPDVALLAPILWGLVEDAASAHRTPTLALTELWLNARASPRYGEICHAWLLNRRNGFHRLAAITGLAPAAMEAVGLYLLTEAAFSVSCFQSLAYRLNAGLLLRDVVARLAGREQDADADGETSRLSALFYAEPDPDGGAQPLADQKGRQARSRESRARIIDAAAAIIEDSGLSAVTNRAVAERAGVSLALTTYHFSSINELTFVGTLRVFQKANRVLETDRNGGHGPDRIRSRQAAAARIKSAGQDSGVERVRNRGMIEIALAAARDPAFGDLGLGMRRQRGTITYSATRALEGGGPSRAMAAGYALWSSAAHLTLSATGGGGAIFDLPAQAELTAERLLRP